MYPLHYPLSQAHNPSPPSFPFFLPRREKRITFPRVVVLIFGVSRGADDKFTLLSFSSSQRGDARPAALFDWGLTCLFSIKGDNEPTGGRLTLGPKHRPALVRTGVRGRRREWRGVRSEDERG